MPGKEVMLRGLYELFFGADQHEVVPIFGRDQTQQSRAFKYFVDHIYDNFLQIISRGGTRTDTCTCREMLFEPNLEVTSILVPLVLLTL